MKTKIYQKTISVRPAVKVAMARWRESQVKETNTAAESVEYPPLESILRPMDRREQLIDSDQRSQVELPAIKKLPHKISKWKSLGRMFTWLSLIFRYTSGNFFDWLLRRDSVVRRAVRLREGLERTGGTFVKLGQQASMRIDLLPWALCVELSKMLDKMVPFPVEQALEIIDRATGKPWQEIFSVFDPEPIGSASMACVYQAILKDGTKVAVKVRRPGIVDVFLADFQVLDWVATIAEFLTFFRPGYSQNLRIDLRATLLEELNFRREGRFQDTFRRNSKKSGRDFFTAPRVYFELTSEEVLVQEYVSGLWLSEVIAATERKDPQGKALLSKLNIDPHIVARRILWAAFWSMDEHIFFHADPHPANILVRENNEITFIDFGSCGSFNSRQRIALEQLVLNLEKKDTEGMTLATLSLLEPLPPADIPFLVKQFQESFMEVLETFNTPAEYTEYWERTSARQWVVLVSVSRKFNLPLNLHMLRMIRATLLYDSIVMRLDNHLDRYHEYGQFMNDRAKMVKNKWRRRLDNNSGETLFLRVEDLGKAVNDLMIRAQTTLSHPILSFGSSVDKWVFVMTVLSRMTGLIFSITLGLVVILYLMSLLTGSVFLFSNVLLGILRSKPYLLFLIFALFFNIRHILFRLRDRDV